MGLPLGFKHSPQTIEKMKKSRIGKKPNLGKKFSEEWRASLSKAKIGNKNSVGCKLSEKHIALLKSINAGNNYALGYRHSEETIQRLSIMRRGPLASNWSGGITPLRKTIRNSARYSQWRSHIMETHDYTCLSCGKRGGDLEVHHHKKSFKSLISDNNIKSLQDALDCTEFWDLENGVVLCVPCHRKETYNVKS